MIDMHLLGIKPADAGNTEMTRSDLKSGRGIKPADAGNTLSVYILIASG